MAKYVGVGGGWVVGGDPLLWPLISFIPPKVAPISRTARTTPITVRRPRGTCIGRLDEETSPLTFTRLWQKRRARVATAPKNRRTVNLVNAYQLIEVSA